MTQFAVYIVDDDHSVRDSIAFFLATVGYAPRQFADATAFLEVATGLVPGCVLLDIRMPRIDGIEVLEMLQRSGNHLPVVVMTGHGDTTTATRAMELGARDFIEKPFEEDALVKTLARIFSTLPSATPKRGRRTGARAVFPHLITSAANSVADIGEAANAAIVPGIITGSRLEGGVPLRRGRARTAER